jgi:hypothetical protein
MKLKKANRCKRCREQMDDDEFEIANGYCQECLPYIIEMGEID